MLQMLGGDPPLFEKILGTSPDPLSSLYLRVRWLGLEDGTFVDNVFYSTLQPLQTTPSAWNVAATFAGSGGGGYRSSTPTLHRRLYPNPDPEDKSMPDTDPCSSPHLQHDTESPDLLNPNPYPHPRNHGSAEDGVITSSTSPPSPRQSPGKRKSPKRPEKGARTASGR